MKRNLNTKMMHKNICGKSIISYAQKYVCLVILMDVTE
jgi:hypothetical protein